MGCLIAAVSGLVATRPADAIRWALNGVSNTTTWLIFAAYIFAEGYSKTGLGKRIALWLLGFLPVGIVLFAVLPTLL